YTNSALFHDPSNQRKAISVQNGANGFRVFRVSKASQFHDLEGALGPVKDGDRQKGWVVTRTIVNSIWPVRMIEKGQGPTLCKTQRAGTKPAIRTQSGESRGRQVDEAEPPRHINPGQATFLKFVHRDQPGSRYMPERFDERATCVLAGVK